MTGVRRELPRSSVAGRPGCGCRIGVARVLLLGGIARHRTLELVVLSGGAQWLLGGDRPDEPGELACAHDNGLVVGLAACVHALPAAMQSLLGAPGVLDGGGVLAGLAAPEFVADGRAAAAVPGGFDQESAGVRGAGLVIEPCRRLSSDERSEGTSPVKLMNCSAVLNL